MPELEEEPDTLAMEQLKRLVFLRGFTVLYKKPLRHRDSRC